jgi:TPR repeat protein
MCTLQSLRLLFSGILATVAVFCWSERAAAQTRGEAEFQQCGQAFKASRWQEAFALCQRAAALGHVDAREGLAVLYEKVNHDYGKAAYYYGLNAPRRPIAANSAAWLYWSGGRNLPADWAKAHQLFQSAAARGYVDAWSSLGFMDELGQGAPHDRARAMQDFGQAARQGNAWARDIRDALSHTPPGRRFHSPQELGQYVVDVDFSHDLAEFQRSQASQPHGRGEPTFLDMMRLQRQMDRDKFCLATVHSTGCGAPP